MNAVAMLRRCGELQRGERPSEWTLRATRSSEAVATAVQEYLPEAEGGEPERPLPPSTSEAWD